MFFRCDLFKKFLQSKESAFEILNGFRLGFLRWLLYFLIVWPTNRSRSLSTGWFFPSWLTMFRWMTSFYPSFWKSGQGFETQKLGEPLNAISVCDQVFFLFMQLQIWNRFGWIQRFQKVSFVSHLCEIVYDSYNIIMIHKLWR